jgi:hypothetical protein
VKPNNIEAAAYTDIPYKFKVSFRFTGEVEFKKYRESPTNNNKNIADNTNAKIFIDKVSSFPNCSTV